MLVDAPAPSGMERYAACFDQPTVRVNWIVNRLKQLMVDLAMPTYEARLIVLEEMKSSPWEKT